MFRRTTGIPWVGIIYFLALSLLLLVVEGLLLFANKGWHVSSPLVGGRDVTGLVQPLGAGFIVITLLIAYGLFRRIRSAQIAGVLISALLAYLPLSSPPIAPADYIAFLVSAAVVVYLLQHRIKLQN